MTAPLIVVAGASGQLGQTLSRCWAKSPISGYQFVALDRAGLDVGKADSAREVLAELKPAVIINAAAYTQVDKAESDSDNAYLINEKAVATLAAWALENEARILHVSTDFVFDGASKIPYLPDQQTRPLGVYGASKRAGEEKIEALVSDHCAIIRTSWLYSEYGSNFVKTMLRLMGEKEVLSVVDDQFGSPTSTHGLANLIFAMIRKERYQGIYHWTDGGSISWFEFAQEIQRQALEKGLLSKAIPIKPISTTEYPTPAQRPAYSVLDRNRALNEFECPQQDWKEQLANVMNELAR
jgi:dTDP-4-dehydrorhamnose reductase